MSRPWSLVDFVLIILGGFLGAGLVYAVNLAYGENDLLLVLVLSLAGQYAGHLLVFWLIARTKRGESIGFSVEPRDILYLGSGMLLQLGLTFLFLPLSSLLLPDGESAQQVADAISQQQSPSARLGAVLVAVILAPLIEEITFRGVFLRSLGSRPRWFLVVVSSAVFAGFHLLGLDPADFLAGVAVVIPQLFIVGVVLAWMTIKNERLGPAIFLHSGFNLLAAIALLIPPNLLESLAG